MLKFALMKELFCFALNCNIHQIRCSKRQPECTLLLVLGSQYPFVKSYLLPYFSKLESHLVLQAICRQKLNIQTKRKIS